MHFSLSSIVSGLLLAGKIASAAPLAAPAAPEESTAAPVVGISGLSEYAQDLFNESMKFQDGFWDPIAGYLITADNTLPGRYDSRQSAWYVVGLVARNENDDMDKALTILKNLYKSQYKDPTKIWYGIIQQCPDEPTPQEGVYEPVSYNSYDSNWRDFVGSAFIILLNDYADVMSEEMLTIVKEMLYLFAKGDQYRVGGLDGDNLYPAYTNPWLMRSVMQSFTGYYLGDQNMTQAGETYGKQIYDLFKLYNTFSEFNSPTYTGVDMWCLGMWINYAAPNSTLPEYAKEMMSYLMSTTKDLYNANLKNFAGPFDRTYGYDMNQYFSLTSGTIWGLVGRDYAPCPANIPGTFHVADFGMAHLIALGIPHVEPYIPDDVKQSFIEYPGEHSMVAQAYSPPFDTYPRNITVWSKDLITIGAETIMEDKIGGPATSVTAFNPAVIQWYVREGRMGYINLYANQPWIHATAGEGYLDITFPNITEWPGYNPAFSFVVSPFDVFPNDNVTTMTSLPGLKLEVSGNVNITSEEFYFNIDSSINNFWSFNSTWYMPEGFVGVPHIHLDITEYPTSKNVTYSLSDL